MVTQVHLVIVVTQDLLVTQVTVVYPVIVVTLVLEFPVIQDTQVTAD